MQNFGERLSGFGMIWYLGSGHRLKFLWLLDWKAAKTWHPERCFIMLDAIHNTLWRKAEWFLVNILSLPKKQYWQWAWPQISMASWLKSSPKPDFHKEASFHNSNNNFWRKTKWLLVWYLCQRGSSGSGCWRTFYSFSFEKQPKSDIKKEAPWVRCNL